MKKNNQRQNVDEMQGAVIFSMFSAKFLLFTSLLKFLSADGWIKIMNTQTYKNMWQTCIFLLWKK